VVEFKSTKDFFKKERSGIKNNTVRIDDKGERFNSLRQFEKGEIKELEIKINCCETLESFKRKIRDVSLFNNEIFIITWGE
jgi:hypothetical protein